MGYGDRMSLIFVKDVTLWYPKIGKNGIFLPVPTYLDTGATSCSVTEYLEGGILERGHYEARTTPAGLVSFQTCVVRVKIQDISCRVKCTIRRMVGNEHDQAFVIGQSLWEATELPVADRMRLRELFVKAIELGMKQNARP